MNLRVERVCFLGRPASSYTQSRWLLSLSKTATKPEDSALNLGNHTLRHHLKVLKTMLLQCYHPANCCQMLVCALLPVSDELRNETLRRAATFQDNSQPAAGQAESIVPMESFPARTLSKNCRSHILKSGQALGDQPPYHMLRNSIMAGA